MKADYSHAKAKPLCAGIGIYKRHVTVIVLAVDTSRYSQEIIDDCIIEFRACI